LFSSAALGHSIVFLAKPFTERASLDGGHTGGTALLHDGPEDRGDVSQTAGKIFSGGAGGVVSLEGVVDAMVEGLKRAGKELTREGLIRGIEASHRFDLGLGPQSKLGYSARDHAGLSTVIPTVVRGGRAVPFTDWSNVR
jgi:branched-chain amino acid transport system substrate-binding protein